MEGHWICNLDPGNNADFIDPQIDKTLDPKVGPGKKWQRHWFSNIKTIAGTLAFTEPVNQKKEIWQLQNHKH